MTPHDTDTRADGATREADFYRVPVLYDIVHEPGTEDEVEGLVATAEQFCEGSGAPGARWFEPGAGTGRYLIEAARRGILGTGVDIESRMIRFARRRARSAGVADRTNWRVGSVSPLPKDVSDLGPFDFAFCPINSLRHFGGDDDVLAHFASVAGVLAPGGVYAVGLSVSLPEGEMPCEDVWEAQRGTIGVKQIVEFWPPSTIEEAKTREEKAYNQLVVTRPRGEERVLSTYTLRTYTTPQWNDLIERSAMRVAGIVDEHGDEMDEPEWGYAVWVLAPRD